MRLRVCLIVLLSFSYIGFSHNQLYYGIEKAPLRRFPFRGFINMEMWKNPTFYNLLFRMRLSLLTCICSCASSVT